MTKPANVYDNYRWEPANKRNGDRWYYIRDQHFQWSLGHSDKREQVIATVQYDSNPKSPYWGKWHVTFGAQSPALFALQQSDVPKFTSNDDAMTWAQTMIALEGLS